MLTKSRWLLLKRPENLSGKPEAKLAALLQYNLRSKIEPMKRVASMLRGHRELLLNWFRAKGQLSSGVVEGFNTKAKPTTRKAFGFRTYLAAKVVLYQELVALPGPEFTHGVC